MLEDSSWVDEDAIEYDHLVTSVDGIDICEGDFDDPGLCACND
jgi:hypothetical protein